MLYQIMNITDSDVYSAVIRFAIQKSTYFSVCTFRSYHRGKLSDRYDSFFEQLSSYQQETDVRTPRPYEKGQRYHVFRLTPKSAEVIRAIPSIECWIVPDYPEDITFYKNKQPWIYMITHERIAYVVAKDTTELCDIVRSSGAKLREVHNFRF